MTHERHVRDDPSSTEDERGSLPSGLWSPSVCAVAAFTLAVLALFGQNAVTVGVGTVLESRFSQGGDTFFVAWGLAIAIQVALVWVLARRAVAVTGGWEAVLGRAAVVLSFVAVLAGALTLLGGWLNG